METDNEALAVIMGSTVNCKTMADDTLRITFDISPKEAKQAFSLFGQRGKFAAIALLKNEESLNYELRQTTEENETEKNKKQTKPAKTTIVEKGEFGNFASSLYRNGFFYNPKLLAIVGSDAQYRHWISYQPSCYSGDFSEWVNGVGRSIAAHVRRSSNSGTGMKPEYSCIPLTHDEHMLQHREGESALVGLEWEKERNNYLILWVKNYLYKEFNVKSLTEIDPIIFNQWAIENGLEKDLPKRFKEIEEVF